MDEDRLIRGVVHEFKEGFDLMFRNRLSALDRNVQYVEPMTLCMFGFVGHAFACSFSNDEDAAQTGYFNEMINLMRRGLGRTVERVFLNDGETSWLAVVAAVDRKAGHDCDDRQGEAADENNPPSVF